MFGKSHSTISQILEPRPKCLIKLSSNGEITENNYLWILFPIDLDEGENAEIEYAIIDGNDNRIFAISRGEQNQGLLTVERRLDREEAGVYLLTIKCFRPYEKKLKSQVSKYNSVVSFFRYSF